MPIVPNPSSTPVTGTLTTLQSVVDSMRVYPDLKPINPVGGFGAEPALTIANDVMQRFLAQPMDWKFNRAIVPPFLTVALQQDYVTSITNLSWLEQGWRIDINNSVNNGSAGPKPIFMLETVRDLQLTAFQANPFNVSYISNSLAQMGTWKANFAYLPGYLTSQTPVQPIQQFIDANGNILYLDSTSLGLSINSPGFTGTAFNPSGTVYGTSGSSQPSASVGAAPGTPVADGTVTWTVADPNGFAMRISPLPAVSGLTWLLVPIYQKNPPMFTSLAQTIAPIPDSYAFLFRQGFMAMALEHVGSKLARDAYMKWEEAIMTTLRASDREREDAVMYPNNSLASGGSWDWIYPLGPSFPYSPFPFS